jgi:hypothetical protein
MSQTSSVRLALKTLVKISDTVFTIQIYDDPSYEGGLRAHLLTYSSQHRGPEVWVDGPELRQLRDFLNQALGE